MPATESGARSTVPAPSAATGSPASARWSSLVTRLPTMPPIAPATSARTTSGTTHATDSVRRRLRCSTTVCGTPDAGGFAPGRSPRRVRDALPRRGTGRLPGARPGGVRRRERRRRRQRRGGEYDGTEPCGTDQCSPGRRTGVGAVRGSVVTAGASGAVAVRGASATGTGAGAAGAGMACAAGAASTAGAGSRGGRQVAAARRRDERVGRLGTRGAVRSGSRSRLRVVVGGRHGRSSAPVTVSQPRVIRAGTPSSKAPPGKAPTSVAASSLDCEPTTWTTVASACHTTCHGS